MSDDVVVDQREWGTVRVTGEDRVRFLQGLCMGNVQALPAGGWLRTATLNVKGRLLSIYDLVKREDDVLLICQPGLADSTRDLLDRHVIADDVALERVDLPVHRVWSSPAAVWTAPPVFDTPTSISSPEAVEVRRIEAGLPLWGVDVDEECFPFETPLAQVIDYGKGCFVGQEPLARVRARGNPSRAMRGLRLVGDQLPARGARISHPEREDAGKVTSVARSFAHGVIALGFLHRQVWQPGGRVTVDGQEADVVELPFG